MYTLDQDICAVLVRKMTLHIHRGNKQMSDRTTVFHIQGKLSHTTDNLPLSDHQLSSMELVITLDSQNLLVYRHPCTFVQAPL